MIPIAGLTKARYIGILTLDQRDQLQNGLEPNSTRIWEGNQIATRKRANSEHCPASKPCNSLMVRNKAEESSQQNTSSREMEHDQTAEDKSGEAE